MPDSIAWLMSLFLFHSHPYSHPHTGMIDVRHCLLIHIYKRKLWKIWFPTLERRCCLTREEQDGGSIIWVLSSFSLWFKSTVGCGGKDCWERGNIFWLLAQTISMFLNEPIEMGFHKALLWVRDCFLACLNPRNLTVKIRHGFLWPQKPHTTHFSKAY